MKRKQTVKPPRSLKRMFPNMTSIVDAKAPVEVHVNKRDCDGATPLDLGHCAMARAAMREFKVDAVVIGISTSYLIKGKKAIRFKTPSSVQREIVSFDRHHDFQPGTYRLVPHAPALRLGYQGGKKRSTTRHNAKRVIHKTALVREFTA